jgi:senataxin
MVAELSRRLTLLDFARLDKGLESAERILLNTEEGKRNQAVLARTDPKALMSLYEALCAPEFHRSQDDLSRHFDFVFEQCQSRKVLKIGDTLPAMARFLFDSNPLRQTFAQNAWQKTAEMLTASSFEWVVHDALSDAILKVSQPLADLPTVLSFWKGFLLLLGWMDEDIITHSLRAMEVQPSIYQVSIQKYVKGFFIRVFTCLRCPIEDTNIAFLLVISPTFTCQLGRSCRSCR